VAGSTTVGVDAMPNNCANAINPNARAVMAVIIVGTDEFDVGQVNVSSVTLEGLEPIRSVYRDRAAPDQCRGLTDGVLDLVLVFETHPLKQALMARGVPMQHGATATIHLQGVMHDGTLFAGEDEVTFKGNPTHNDNGFGRSGVRSIGANRH